MDFNRSLSLLAALLLTVSILGVGLAMVGSVSAAERANESVTFDDENETATVDLTWNSSISAATNTTADVVFYNATEYNDDPANATVVHSETITSDPGNTTTHNYSTSGVSALETGTDYVIAVEGTDSDLDDVAISTPGGGGFLAGASGSEKGLIALALVGVAAFLFRKNDRGRY